VYVREGERKERERERETKRTEEKRIADPTHTLSTPRALSSPSLSLLLPHHALTTP
jgi:hypothetical protein